MTRQVDIQIIDFACSLLIQFYPKIVQSDNVLGDTLAIRYIEMCIAVTLKQYLDVNVGKIGTIIGHIDLNDFSGY